MIVATALNYLEEFGLQFLGNGTGLAVTDSDIIDCPYWCDLSSGPGKEEFIGGVEFAASDTRLVVDLVAKTLGSQRWTPAPSLKEVAAKNWDRRSSPNQ